MLAGTVTVNTLVPAFTGVIVTVPPLLPSLIDAVATLVVADDTVAVTSSPVYVNDNVPFAPYVTLFVVSIVIVLSALFIVIVALAVGLVSVWVESPFTYACTYVVPTFVLLGFVVDQLPHVLLSVLVL